MFLSMKKGSAKADQSKRRTNHTRLLSLSLSYHWQQVLSMEKYRNRGSVGELIEETMVHVENQGIKYFYKVEGDE